MIILVIIYLAFISLGLPDSVLGSAWPAIRIDWTLPLDGAGYISLVLVSGSILSSFMSGRIIRRFGTARVTLISCMMTGLALLGYSLAPSYVWLLLLALPLGLGGGSVDAALNNYVANHYKAHHMNWLHAFWGLGATLGPVIMSLHIAKSWQAGYRTIAMIQLSLAVIILLTLGAWPKEKHEQVEEKNKLDNLKGVPFALGVFLFYCMIEFSTGLWGASYLVESKGISPKLAARFIAMYYGGITLGRIISGFLSFKWDNKQMIQIGIGLSSAALVMMLLPLPQYISLVSLILLGIGLAPIFPSMIHETPHHFSKESSQTIIGYQMAFGGIGSAFLPPLIGILIKFTNINLFPVILLGGMCLLVVCVYKLFNLKVS